MAEQSVVSHPGELKLRKAFGFLHSWTANGLANRLREEDIGVASKNAARILIFEGHACGLLRRDGPATNYIYRLNKDWQRPKWSRLRNGYEATGDAVVRVRKSSPPERTDSAPAGNYVGPAFATGALTTHLGTRAVEGVDADGELLPWRGNEIVDALNRQFRAEFLEA